MKIIDNSRLLAQIRQNSEYKRFFSNEADKYAFPAEIRQGETIIYQQAPSEYLYYLYKGKCQVTAYMENGKAVIINTLNAPCLIGEIELIKNDYPFSVDALKNCTVAAFPIDPCRNILLHDTEFLYQLCSALVDKERKNALNLAHHISFPFEYRLAKFILDNSDGKVFKVKKTVIAESLGISYRHLEKVMKNFVDQGFLQKEKLTYYITDVNARDKLSKSLNVFYKS